MNRSWSLAILFFSLPPSLSGAGVLSGQVVDVVDGDTVDIQHDDGIARIRLHGIDAPEKGQNFAHHATQFLEGLTAGQSLTVDTRGQDQSGHTIGEVFLFDGRHLNKELVKVGLAWWFCQFSADPELHQLEDDARAAKLGLWSDPDPVPPWVFRKRLRAHTPPVSDEGCPRPASQTLGQSIGVHDIIGDRRSHIYHRVDCPGYAAVSPEHRMPFVSIDAAEQAGYREAGNCP